MADVRISHSGFVQINAPPAAFERSVCRPASQYQTIVLVLWLIHELSRAAARHQVRQYLFFERWNVLIVVIVYADISGAFVLTLCNLLLFYLIRTQQDKRDSSAWPSRTLQLRHSKRVHFPPLVTFQSSDQDSFRESLRGQEDIPPRMTA